MEQSLIQMGFDVTVTEDGGYIAIMNDYNNPYSGSAIIIPPGYENADGISYLFPGQAAGGYLDYGYGGLDTLGPGGFAPRPALVTKAKQGDWPPSPVIMAPSDMYPITYNDDRSGQKFISQYNPDINKDPGVQLLDGVYQALQKNGAKIEDIGVMGFSNGGVGAMNTLGGFLELHDGQKFNAKVFLADAYNLYGGDPVGLELFELYEKNPSKLTENQLTQLERMKQLIKNGTKIICTYDTDRNDGTYLRVFRKRGFNAYGMQGTGRAHYLYMTDPINGNVLSWLIGTGSLSLGENYEKPYYYNSKGEKIFLNVNEARNLGLYFGTDAAYEYLYLSRLSSVGNVKDLSQVKSNKDYVYYYMDQLRGKISNSSIFTSGYSLPNCEGISALINECINKYDSVYVKMLDKLAKESEAVISYALSYELLDEKQAEMAKKL